MGKIFRKLVLFVCLFLSSATPVLAARSAPLIADHNAVLEFDSIPSSWINQAKQDFRISYGHTSHGSQVVTGMGMLSRENSLFNYNSTFLCDSCISGASDLGNPNRTAWATATRNYLNGSGSNKNMIMWSWCGQVSNASTSEIDLYLSLMNELEDDFPNVTFIYMTGHLDGGGISGNLHRRNEQIRGYCRDNDKVLFDFADIERHDPNGVDYPNETDSCGWCSSWCSTHSCPSCASCAHSHCFNCYQKGKAFWWMMARLSGWGSSASPSPSPTPTPIPTPDPISQILTVLANWLGNYSPVDFVADGKINALDFGWLLRGE